MAKCLKLRDSNVTNFVSLNILYIPLCTTLRWRTTCYDETDLNSRPLYGTLGLVLLELVQDGPGGVQVAVRGELHRGLSRGRALPQLLLYQHLREEFSKSFEMKDTSLHVVCHEISLINFYN